MTLYFHFKVRRARVIKKKQNYGEFIDHQPREVWVVLALVNVFEKSEKKNKTTSV